MSQRTTRSRDCRTPYACAWASSTAPAAWTGRHAPPGGWPRAGSATSVPPATAGATSPTSTTSSRRPCCARQASTSAARHSTWPSPIHRPGTSTCCASARRWGRSRSPGFRTATCASRRDCSPHRSSSPNSRCAGYMPTASGDTAGVPRDGAPAHPPRHPEGPLQARARAHSRRGRNRTRGHVVPGEVGTQRAPAQPPGGASSTNTSMRRNSTGWPLLWMEM